MKQVIKRLSVFFSLAILVLAGLQVQPAFGQAETGLINGTITDQSGASVPKAKVTVLEPSIECRFSDHDRGGYGPRWRSGEYGDRHAWHSNRQRAAQ